MNKEVNIHLILISVFLAMFFFFMLINDAGINLAPSVIEVNGGGQSAIVEAISRAQPGDTILVKSGNYDDGSSSDLLITKSGTSSAPIHLKADSGKRPILGNIEFDNAKFWIIEGFEIKNQDSFASLVVDGSSSKNIVIRNMLIHDIRYGISLTGGQDHVIEDSTVYNAIDKKGRSHQGAHCIHITDAKNTIIRRNTLYGFIADAIQLMKPSDGGTFNRGTTIIENNLMYNSQGPCAENAVDIKAERGTVIIRNNIMYGFEPMTGDGCEYKASGSPSGVVIVGHGGSDGNLIVEGNEFYDSVAGITQGGMSSEIKNNIFHDFREGRRLDENENPTGRWLGAIQAEDNQVLYHNTFVNIPNLFEDFNLNKNPDLVNNLFYNVQNTRTGNYRYNAWYGNNDRQSGTGDITGSYPRINLDYSLMQNSPLINKGANDINVNKDKNGKIRDSSPDIGAFEYNAQSPNNCIDKDNDGYGTDCSLGSDCNDNNTNINPSITEICGNNIDEDCSGSDQSCGNNNQNSYDDKSNTQTYGKVEIRIADSNDDAEENINTGEIDLTSTDLEFVRDDRSTGKFEQIVGMRFTSIEIPRQAKINNASIQFTVDDPSSEDTNIQIYGEANDNSNTFSSVNNDIVSRTKTTASVQWDIPPWPNSGESTENQKTPDLSKIIQEIINREDWVYGNSITFLVKGSGKRTAESYDKIGSTPAKLIIEFSTGECRDNDSDGYGTDCSLGSDCNDNNTNINPSITEICGNNIDEDCSGSDLICSNRTSLNQSSDDNKTNQEMRSEQIDIAKDNNQNNKIIKVFIFDKSASLYSTSLGEEVLLVFEDGFEVSASFDISGDKTVLIISDDVFVLEDDVNYIKIDEKEFYIKVLDHDDNSISFITNVDENNIPKDKNRVKITAVVIMILVIILAITAIILFILLNKRKKKLFN